MLFRNFLIFAALLLASSFAKAQTCNASFSHFVNGLTVTFTNNSTGTAPAWYEFGDGSGWVQETTNPTQHTYAAPGMYYVTLGLEANGIPYGCDSTGMWVTVCGQSSFTVTDSGLTVTVTDNSVGGSATWYNFGDGSGWIQATSNPFQHTYAAPGNYYITQGLEANGLPYGCDSSGAYAAVDTFSCGTAAFTVADSGLTVTVTDNSTGNAPAWYNFGDGSGWIQATSNPFQHTYAAPGNYYITLGLEQNGLPYGCDSTGNYVSVDTISTGMPNEVWDASITVYPNPVGNTLSVRMDKFVPDAVLRLSDAQGRQVQAIKLHADAETDTDVSTLPPGMYFGRIESGGIPVKTIKVIKR